MPKIKFSDALCICTLEWFNNDKGEFVISDKATKTLFCFLVDNQKMIAEKLDKLELLETEAATFIEMLIKDWTFRREQTGIEQPDSPELANAKELLKKLRGQA